MGRLKRLLLRCYGLLLRAVGVQCVATALTTTAAALARALPARRSLRFLLDLDERLYPHQGEAAVRYDDGLHVKHRLLRYHDFFVERIAAGQTVLDIGCGLGAVAYSVAGRSGAHVTGIDRNPESIARARSRFVLPNLDFVCGDAFDDLPTKRFDVVILSNVLEHFEERVEFLRRLRKQIDPVTLLIRVPLFERDWRVAAKRELGLEWRLDATHCIEYDLPIFLAETSDGGYEVVEYQVRWGEIWARLRAVTS